MPVVFLTVVFLTVVFFTAVFSTVAFFTIVFWLSYIWILSKSYLHPSCSQMNLLSTTRRMMVSTTLSLSLFCLFLRVFFFFFCPSPSFLSPPRFLPFSSPHAVLSPPLSSVLVDEFIHSTESLGTEGKGSVWVPTEDDGNDVCRSLWSSVSTLSRFVCHITSLSNHPLSLSLSHTPFFPVVFPCLCLYVYRGTQQLSNDGWGCLHAVSWRDRSWRH